MAKKSKSTEVEQKTNETRTLSSQDQEKLAKLLEKDNQITMTRGHLDFDYDMKRSQLIQEKSQVADQLRAALNAAAIACGIDPTNQEENWTLDYQDWKFVKVVR